MFCLYYHVYEIQKFVRRRTFYDGDRSADMRNLLQVNHLWSNCRPLYFLFWFLNINRSWLLCIFSISSKFTTDRTILRIILNDYVSYFLIFFSLCNLRWKFWTIWYFFNVLHYTNSCSCFCLFQSKRS